MITNIDHQLGRIIGRLHMMNEWNNTWVIYTTDHGEHLGDYGGQVAKSSFLDVSARLPFIVRPPQEVGCSRGSVCDQLIGVADLLPSICGIGGAEVPGDVTGKSWLPMVSNTEIKNQDFFHGHINNTHMYLEPPFKYIYYAEDGAELVFNMDKDPQETTDLSKDKALTQGLRVKLIKHLEEEGHEHVKGGKLLSRGEKREDDRVYRSKDASGIRPAGW
jgi:arylsulfatase A-like enzyme